MLEDQVLLVNPDVQEESLLCVRWAGKGGLFGGVVSWRFEGRTQGNSFEVVTSVVIKRKLLKPCIFNKVGKRE